MLLKSVYCVRGISPHHTNTSCRWDKKTVIQPIRWIKMNGRPWWVKADGENLARRFLVSIAFMFQSSHINRVYLEADWGPCFQLSQSACLLSTRVWMAVFTITQMTHTNYIFNQTKPVKYDHTFMAANLYLVDPALAVPCWCTRMSSERKLVLFPPGQKRAISPLLCCCCISWNGHSCYSLQSTTGHQSASAARTHPETCTHEHA